LPPKYRGRVNIGIDGTWHLGGSFAAVLNMFLGEIDNWRHLFAIGIFGVLALLIMRRSIPESPRWLLLKKKYVQADLVVKSIEYAVLNKRVFL
jgi:MFS family permease